MMSMFGRVAAEFGVRRSTLLFNERAQQRAGLAAGYSASPSKWRSRSNGRRRVIVEIRDLNSFLSLVFRAALPSRRRLHVEPLPRGRDLRYQPDQRLVRVLLRHRV